MSRDVPYSAHTDDIELDINDSAADTTPSSAPAASSFAAAAATPMMNITIKTLTGQAFNVQVPDSPSTTVDELKLALFRSNDIPVSFQRLIYAGRELRDGQPLQQYNIKDGHVVHVVLKQNTNAQPPPPGDAHPAAGEPAAPPGADPNAAMFQNYNGFVLQMPAAGSGDTNPWRIRQVFQLSKIVKLFAIIDSIFLIIWSFNYPPLAIGILLAMCGYYGAQTFRVPFIAAYLLFISISIGVRTYFTMIATSVALTLLLTLGIFVEVYIMSLVWRFLKLVRELTPAEKHELMMMQQGGLMA